MASSSNSRSNEFHNRAVWDVDNECWSVNGDLFPAPPARVAAAPLQLLLLPVWAQYGLDIYGVRRRRNLKASRILETWVYTFKLFFCVELLQDILEMTEVLTGDRTYYVLTPYERDGKRRMEAQEIDLGNKEISPVRGEACANVEKKTNLTMEQRLAGRWTMEVRQRIESMKVERFYTHERVDKTFRSMHDVATYILYNRTY